MRASIGFSRRVATVLPAGLPHAIGGTRHGELFENWDPG